MEQQQENSVQCTQAPPDDNERYWWVRFQAKTYWTKSGNSHVESHYIAMKTSGYPHEATLNRQLQDMIGRQDTYKETTVITIKNIDEWSKERYVAWIKEEDPEDDESSSS